MGLDTILVKRFVENHSKRFSYVVHALVIRYIAALLSILIVNVLGLALVEEQYRLLLFVMSLLHLFVPLNIFEWYFQSQGRAELTAISLIIGSVLSFLFLISCLSLGLGLVWLALSYSVGLLTTGLVLIALYLRSDGKVTMALSIPRMRKLFKEALPLIFSGALVLLYMKADQVMLGMMKNPEEVGYYTAATRLSEAWFFVGMTIISVYFPRFLSVRKTKGQAAYEKEIVKIGTLIFWLSVLLAVVTMGISDWLINVLYSPDFSRSADILAISIWTVPFVYLGTISTKMYIAMNKNSVIFWRSLSGLLINIFLNIPLIYYYGAIGAAVSTVASQFMTGFLFNMFNLDIFRTQSQLLTFSLLKQPRNTI